MSPQITQRDKRLLMALGMLCICLIYGRFIAKPLLNVNLSLCEQIRQNQRQIQQMQENAEKLADAQEENAVLRENLAAKTVDLYPILSAQEIDKLLAEKVQEKGLLIKRLRITMPEKSANVTGFGDTKGAGSNPDAGEGVRIAQVEMQISGNEEDINSLLHTIAEEMPGILVTNIGWSGKDRERGDRVPGSGYDTAVIHLGILMTRKE